MRTRTRSCTRPGSILIPALFVLGSWSVDARGFGTGSPETRESVSRHIHETKRWVRKVEREGHPHALLARIYEAMADRFGEIARGMK